MKICGHEYKIKLGNPYPKLRRDDDRYYFGHVKYSRCIIHVDAGSKRDVQEETLIHEVIHAILLHSHDWGEHTEHMVNAIANGLFQLGLGKHLWKLAKPQKETT